MMQRKTILTTIIAIFFLTILFPVCTHAATITIVQPQSVVGVGDEFAVPILLSSEAESINAIALDMTFSDTTLSAVRVLSGNSIVSSWIEQPEISGNAIVLSGIMPGGYRSVTDPVTNQQLPGTIATIIFRVDHPGTARVDFTSAQVYRNDGSGSEANLTTIPLALSLSVQGSGLHAPIVDTIPPLSFTPVLSSDPSIYDGGQLVIFSTTDKESGIAYYEVDEGNGQWIKSESPHLLANGVKGGPIRVKAVDMAGNYTIGIVPLPVRPSLVVIGIVLLALVLAIVVGRVVVLKHVHHHKKKLTKNDPL